MKILYYLPKYVPDYNSGDSVMAHTIATYLQSHGHEVTVMLPKCKPYEHQGIKVVSRSSSLFREADAIFCQLDQTNEAIQLAGDKPVFHVMHNTFSRPTIKANPQVNVIYNSQAAVSMMGWENDYYVLPPVVDYDKYNVERIPQSITLINANENKGGKIVHEIAKRMPERDFLVVIGAYGTQFVSLDRQGPAFNINNEPLIHGLGKLPNVCVLKHQKHLDWVYMQTRILLMPSLYESWGMVASEAMCSGIPVISSPTFGLLENIGENGIFVERDNIDAWVMAIKKLDEKKEYDEASAYSRKRAIENNTKEKLEGLLQFVQKKVTAHKKKKEYGIQ